VLVAFRVANLGAHDDLDESVVAHFIRSGATVHPIHQIRNQRPAGCPQSKIPHFVTKQDQPLCWPATVHCRLGQIYLTQRLRPCAARIDDRPNDRRDAKKAVTKWSPADRIYCSTLRPDHKLAVWSPLSSPMAVPPEKLLTPTTRTGAEYENTNRAVSVANSGRFISGRLLLRPFTWTPLVLTTNSLSGTPPGGKLSCVPISNQRRARKTPLHLHARPFQLKILPCQAKGRQQAMGAQSCNSSGTQLGSPNKNRTLAARNGKTRLLGMPISAQQDPPGGNGTRAPNRLAGLQKERVSFIVDWCETNMPERRCRDVGPGTGSALCTAARQRGPRIFRSTNSRHFPRIFLPYGRAFGIPAMSPPWLADYYYYLAGRCQPRRTSKMDLQCWVCAYLRSL
jgi:hypothetical protein